MSKIEPHIAIAKCLGEHRHRNVRIDKRRAETRLLGLDRVRGKPVFFSVWRPNQLPVTIHECLSSPRLIWRSLPISFSKDFKIGAGVLKPRSSNLGTVASWRCRSATFRRRFTRSRRSLLCPYCLTGPEGAGNFCSFDLPCAVVTSPALFCWLGGGASHTKSAVIGRLHFEGPNRVYLLCEVQWPS